MSNKPKNTEYVKRGQKEDMVDSSSMYGKGYDEEADKLEQLNTLRRLHKENPDVYPDPDKPVEIDPDDVFETSEIDQHIVVSEEATITAEAIDINDIAEPGAVIPIKHPEKVAHNLGLIDKNYTPEFDPQDKYLANIEDMDLNAGPNFVRVTLRVPTGNENLLPLVQRYLVRQDVVICTLPEIKNSGGDVAEPSKSSSTTSD